MNTLQGRVALVTGSSRGIGAAIAVAFHPARALWLRTAGTRTS